jgi:hypothetical protein
LNNTIILDELDKIHIFKSRFHASKAVSNEAAIVLEIESPEDKHDLVRLSDSSGRQNSKYETKENFTPKDGTELWIPEAVEADREINIFGKKIGHLIADSNWITENVNQNTKLVITEGSLQAENENKILNPGDVIDVRTLSTLCKHFEFEKNSKYIYIAE